MLSMLLGFLINPIAGLGGSVGLKGTDGLVEEALRRGATLIAGQRAKKCMEEMNIDAASFILTCSSEMGEDAVINNSLRYEVVYSFDGRSTSEDTKNACKTFLEEDVDLLLFCGGDGTARDVYSVVGKDIPVIGIPAGVKKHTGETSCE